MITGHTYHSLSGRGFLSCWHVVTFSGSSLKADCLGLYIPRWESYLTQYVHSRSVLVNYNDLYKPINGKHACLNIASLDFTCFSVIQFWSWNLERNLHSASICRCVHRLSLSSFHMSLSCLGCRVLEFCLCGESLLFHPHHHCPDSGSSWF